MDSFIRMCLPTLREPMVGTKRSNPQISMQYHLARLAASRQAHGAADRRAGRPQIVSSSSRSLRVTPWAETNWTVSSKHKRPSSTRFTMVPIFTTAFVRMLTAKVTNRGLNLMLIWLKKFHRLKVRRFCKTSVAWRATSAHESATSFIRSRRTLTILNWQSSRSTASYRNVIKAYRSVLRTLALQTRRPVVSVATRRRTNLIYRNKVIKLK